MVLASWILFIYAAHIGLLSIPGYETENDCKLAYKQAYQNYNDSMYNSQYVCIWSK